MTCTVCRGVRQQQTDILVCLLRFAPALPQSSALRNPLSAALAANPLPDALPPPAEPFALETDWNYKLFANPAANAPGTW